jgi:hypothetical protein
VKLLYIAGFILYAAVLLGGMAYVSHFSGAHSRLVREVTENQYLEASDLAPVDADKIVHHYARRHMKAGEKITAADVTSEKIPPSNSSLAVVVSYPLLKGRKPLRPGDSIRLCLDGKRALPDAIPVQAVECDAASCAATVLLKDIPKDFTADGALTRLRVSADPSDDCSGKGL